MPYTNIVFVKIQMTLLEDDRFLIDLNDTQKGLYLMLLGLAGKTDNKIRNDIGFIKSRLNIKNIKKSDILKISQVFPRFNLQDGYWQFDKFEEIHNYTIGKSEGNPKELQRSVQNQKKNQKQNKKEKENESPLNLDSLTNGILNTFKPQEINLLKNRIEQYLKHPIDSEANEAVLKETIGRMNGQKPQDRMAYATSCIKNLAMGK